MQRNRIGMVYIYKRVSVTDLLQLQQTQTKSQKRKTEIQNELLFSSDHLSVGQSTDCSGKRTSALRQIFFIFLSKIFRSCYEWDFRQFPARAKYFYSEQAIVSCHKTALCISVCYNVLRIDNLHAYVCRYVYISIYHNFQKFS